MSPGKRAGREPIGALLCQGILALFFGLSVLALIGSVFSGPRGLEGWAVPIALLFILLSAGFLLVYYGILWLSKELREERQKGGD
jgi:hypothetical protein